jgi:glucose uptake protein
VVAVALAFKTYSMAQWMQLVREGKTKTTKKVSSNKAITLSAVGGLFIGGYAPMIELARFGDNGLGPYSVILVAAVGLVAATVVFNLFLMNLPIQGDPVDIAQYLRAKSRTHALGILGGLLWGAGSIALTVAGRAEGAAALNPAILYATEQAGVIVATLWGIYRWNEFEGADTKVRFLSNVTLILLVIGVALTSFSLAGVGAK